MKRILFIAIIMAGLSASSCKKEKEYCWVCHDNYGNDMDPQCDKSDSDIHKVEQENGWSCTKK